MRRPPGGRCPAWPTTCWAPTGGAGARACRPIGRSSTAAPGPGWTSPCTARAAGWSTTCASRRAPIRPPCGSTSPARRVRIARDGSLRVGPLRCSRRGRTSAGGAGSPSQRLSPRRRHDRRPARALRPPRAAGHRPGARLLDLPRRQRDRRGPGDRRRRGRQCVRDRADAVDELPGHGDAARRSDAFVAKLAPDGGARRLEHLPRRRRPGPGQRRSPARRRRRGRRRDDDLDGLPDAGARPRRTTRGYQGRLPGRALPRRGTLVRQHLPRRRAAPTRPRASPSTRRATPTSSGTADSTDFPPARPVPGRAAAATRSRPRSTGEPARSSTHAILGGGGNDQRSGVAVDADGNALLHRRAGSIGLPDHRTRCRPANARHAATRSSTKLDPTGAPVYSTYLGGAGLRRGGTRSRSRRPARPWSSARRSRPTSRPARHRRTAHGPSDAFVARLTAAGTGARRVGLPGRRAASRRPAASPSTARAASSSPGARCRPTSRPRTPPRRSRAAALDAFVTQLDAAGTTLGLDLPRRQRRRRGRTASPSTAPATRTSPAAPAADFPTASALQGTTGGGSTRSCRAGDRLGRRRRRGRPPRRRRPWPCRPRLAPGPPEPETAIIARPPAADARPASCSSASGAAGGPDRPLAAASRSAAGVDGGAFRPCTSPYTTARLASPSTRSRCGR